VATPAVTSPQAMPPTAMANPIKYSANDIIHLSLIE
jgi:hypothetical protein